MAITETLTIPKEQIDAIEDQLRVLESAEAIDIDEWNELLVAQRVTAENCGQLALHSTVEGPKDVR